MCWPARQIQRLSNPVHRVNEIYASRDTLLAGHEAVEQHAAFQAQNAVPFKELRQLVQNLIAIEHRIEPGTALEALLADFRAAASATSFPVKDVWNSLQSRKGQALLELTPLLDGWRQNARAIIEEALGRLPADVAHHDLELAFADSLRQPLSQLADSLDAATIPSQVAAFPERARQLVRQLGQCMTDEAARKERSKKRKDGQGTGGTGPPTRQRPLRVVRVADVATITRVSSVPEWEDLSKKLDEKVRSLLAEGSDVELG